VRIGNSGSQEVDRVVRSRIGLFRACYQLDVNRNGNIQGRFVARISVDADGSVADVNLANSSLPMTGDCVNRNLRRLKFPAGSAGTFNVPFVFTFQ
jgi:hypothetical protein